MSEAIRLPMAAGNNPPGRAQDADRNDWRQCRSNDGVQHAPSGINRLHEATR